MYSQAFWRDKRCALFAAHPAHELRLYGWLKAARPVVSVLTDGSGRNGSGRLPSTESILSETGATRGTLFGKMTDRVLYQSLLGHNHEPLRTIVDLVADELVSEQIDIVVADALEHFFLAHDVMSLVVRAALERANAKRFTPIRLYEYTLLEEPPKSPVVRQGDSLRIDLSAQVFDLKLKAARGYREVATEVERAFSAFGTESFATEWLNELQEPAILPTPQSMTEYERHGHALVSQGVYQEAVTYNDHFLPLCWSLLAVDSVPTHAVPTRAAA